MQAVNEYICFVCNKIFTADQGFNCPVCGSEDFATTESHEMITEMECILLYGGCNE